MNQAGTASALGADSGDEQILGDNFIAPPDESVPAEPGPTPPICLGPSTISGVAAPFGNAASDESASLDFALEDFQPQSCGFQSIYGLNEFSDRVTLAVLLASW